ncbi:MAG: TetR/AcrR family transcriptional regulator [Lachnospiraceae bacterium]|nr:TetR/AcrR family transcriptional regulator [Lachnospiraceae bacterium]
MNPYKYVCDLPVVNVTASQESIEKALLALLDEKEVYRISVKEICEKANVARSTFYTYYDVIDDCLLIIENRFLHNIIELTMRLEGHEKIEKIDLGFIEETLEFIQSNQKMLYLFMIKRYNARFINKWKDAIKYHLYQRMPTQIAQKNRELTMEIIASVAMGAYQYWLRNPYDIDVDYVKHLIRKTIKGYTEG